MKKIPITPIFWTLGLLSFYEAINNYIHFHISGYDASAAVFWAIIAMGFVVSGTILQVNSLSVKKETHIPEIGKDEFIVLSISLVGMVLLSVWEQAANYEGEETVGTIASIIRDAFEIISTITIIWVMRGGKLHMINSVKDISKASKKKQLKEMLDSGVLTEEEYEKAINSL